MFFLWCEIFALAVNRNSNGPRTEPCGTTAIINQLIDKSLIITFGFHLDRKPCIHIPTYPLNPTTISLWSRIPWSILSKASGKSKYFTSNSWFSVTLLSCVIAVLARSFTTLSLISTPSAEHDLGLGLLIRLYLMTLNSSAMKVMQFTNGLQSLSYFTWFSIKRNSVLILFSIIYNRCFFWCFTSASMSLVVTRNNRVQELSLVALHF